MKGFRYEQSSGALVLVNDDYECPLHVCAAGRADGLNNPEMQHVRNVGPLPRGRYHMRVVEHPRFASPAIRLDWSSFQKEGMENFGRSGFFIHGGSKSEGCILVNGCIRALVATAIGCGFDILEVVR